MNKIYIKVFPIKNNNLYCYPGIMINQNRITSKISDPTKTVFTLSSKDSDIASPFHSEQCSNIHIKKCFLQVNAHLYNQLLKKNEFL